MQLHWAEQIWQRTAAKFIHLFMHFHKYALSTSHVPVTGLYSGKQNRQCWPPWNLKHWKYADNRQAYEPSDTLSQWALLEGTRKKSLLQNDCGNS